MGLGKLGFVADLLSKEVQVGYMNGLAVTIIVGQLPKLFGFSTDADAFIDEVQAFFSGLDQTDTTTLAVGRRAWPSCCAPAAHPPRAVGAGGGRRRHHRVGGVRARGAGREDGGLPAAGRPHAVLPLDELERRGAAAHRRRRHHPGLSDRHHRHVDELRRPAWRRGRRRPGDDRHGRRQHRRRVLPGLRGVDERVAHGRGRAVRRQEPGHRPGGRRPRRPDAAVLPLACSPTSRRPRWPRS